MPDEELPNISFVMPVYNRPLFLRDSVASIFNGNFRSGDELIIVDDGSTDATPEVIAELAAMHPQIRAMRHRFNKGSAAAGRNTAIDSAKNDWIFCLDSDNLLLPGSIQPLLQFALQNNADAAAFGAQEYFKDDPDVVLYTQTYKHGQVALADGLTGHIWPGPSGNYLFTQSSWIRAGRQNEFVGGGIDSWAFGVRQLAAGHKMVTMAGSVYKHRVGHDSAYTQDEKDGLTSLKGLQALIPILHLLEEETVDYLFAKESRKKWFDLMGVRPLKVRGTNPGVAGTQQVFTKPASLLFRVRWHLARLIAPSEK